MAESTFHANFVWPVNKILGESGPAYIIEQDMDGKYYLRAGRSDKMWAFNDNSSLQELSQEQVDKLKKGAATWILGWLGMAADLNKNNSSNNGK